MVLYALVFGFLLGATLASAVWWGVIYLSHPEPGKHQRWPAEVAQPRDALARGDYRLVRPYGAVYAPYSDASPRYDYGGDYREID